jgi:putative membrane protein
MVRDTRGLQAERTALSWERSALGFLVGGALVLLRPHGPLQAGRIALASLAAALALLVLALGYLRSHRLRGNTRTIPPPRAEVLLTGYGTGFFALAIVVALLFTA